MPVPMLVDLVNGWGTVPRARGGDRERPPVPAFRDRHAVPDPLAALLRDPALERAADRLYPVFAAGDPADRSRLVTDLLRTCGIHPALAATDGAIAPRWLVARDRDGLLAAGALALHGQLVEHGHERVGTCASPSCGDVYVDTSPAGHRRFCSVTCQGRERVAAFRRRRAAS